MKRVPLSIIAASAVSLSVPLTVFAGTNGNTTQSHEIKLQSVSVNNLPKTGAAAESVLKATVNSPIQSSNASSSINNSSVKQTKTVTMSNVTVNGNSIALSGTNGSTPFHLIVF